MAEYTYRMAGAADAKRLSELRVDFTRALHTIDDADCEPLRRSNEEFFRATLTDGSYVVWVAEAEGDIVSTSGLSLVNVPPRLDNPSGHMAYITFVYTAPEHRGHGLAGTLMGRMMDEARAYGCARAMLVASDMGRPLYEKLGFAVDPRSMIVHLNEC